MIIVQCFKCSNYIGKRKCRGFKKDQGWIPQSIYTNKIKHIKPFPGDNGIQFEPMKED